MSGGHSHGKRGELRQRYREGQEDQLDALGLVVNVIALWNTSYMQRGILSTQNDGNLVSTVGTDSPLL